MIYILTVPLYINCTFVLLSILGFYMKSKPINTEPCKLVELNIEKMPIKNEVLKIITREI